MKKTIKFEMPERERPSDQPEADSELKIEVDSPNKEQNLFRSRWSEVRGSQKPKPLWKTPAGMRLLFLCVLLIGVIWAMSRAGKPESWNWLFKLDPNFEAKQGENDDDSPKNNGAANLILSGSDNPTRDDDVAQTDDDQPNKDNSPETDDSTKLTFVTEGPVDRIEIDFWKSYLKSLNGKQQVRLFWLLDSVTHHRKLPTGETSAINPVLRKLIDRRKRFHQSLAESGNSDTSLYEDWQNEFLPVLKAAIIDQDQSNAASNETFLRTVDYIRKAADSLVDDKTPIERPREAYAWFAAWSDVFDAPMEQGDQQKATVTQLLSQPNSYRGKWVSISGTVLRMNEVMTSNNPLGIERYYVMWIKPDHPSSFPFCVYSLMAPETMLQQAKENNQVVEVPIQTTARFFKNRIFPSDQPAFAPVLMTASVNWTPEAQPVASSSSLSWPSRGNSILMLGIIGGFAILIAWSVFRSTLGSAARSLPKSDFLSENFSQLQEDKRVETTKEKLIRMSEQGLSTNTDDRAEASSNGELQSSQEQN